MPAVAILRISPLHKQPAFLATAGILAGWVVVAAGLIGGVPAVRCSAGLQPCPVQP